MPYKAPKNPGIEQHRGILDVWAGNNIDGYDVTRPRGSTTVAMSKAEHDATKAVYRDWLRERTGRAVGGRVDWTRVSPREILALSERMFDAAGTSRHVRDEYYATFNRYIYGLN